MIRFFVEPRNISGGDISVRGDCLHYLKNVLRAREGMKVKAFDGEGREYLCSIDSIGSSLAELSVIDVYSADNELSVDISLALGISKPKSFEFSLQKATELGVKKIIPMITERSLPCLSPSKLARAQKIILSAARQCGRSVFPLLEEPQGFLRAAGNASSHELSMIPWEEEENLLVGRVLESKNCRKILLFIGPEGGFTADEIKAAKKSGIVPVSLGPRILRSETAAAAVVSMVVYRYDLKGR